MSQEAEQSEFGQWCVVAQYGHTTLAGFVSVGKIGGMEFIRIDVPEVEGQAAFTKFLGKDSIFDLTPVSEAIARHVAKAARAKPVTAYALPEPRGPELYDDGQGDGDFDEDEDDDPNDRF